MPSLLGRSEVRIWDDIQEPFPETMGAGEPLFSPSPVASMRGTGSPDPADPASSLHLPSWGPMSWQLPELDKA